MAVKLSVSDASIRERAERQAAGSNPLSRWLLANRVQPVGPEARRGAHASRSRGGR